MEKSNITSDYEEQGYCDPWNHSWKEEYYGYKCIHCGMFVPFGCEPWRPDEY